MQFWVSTLHNTSQLYTICSQQERSLHFTASAAKVTLSFAKNKQTNKQNQKNTWKCHCVFVQCYFVFMELNLVVFTGWTAYFVNENTWAERSWHTVVSTYVGQVAHFDQHIFKWLCLF